MLQTDDLKMIGILDYLKSKLKPGSIKGSIFALTTSVVGAGLISLPLATYSSGILFTYVQLLVSAYLCIYSNMLLVIYIICRRQLD